MLPRFRSDASSSTGLLDTGGVGLMGPAAHTQPAGSFASTGQQPPQALVQTPEEAQAHVTVSSGAWGPFVRKLSLSILGISLIGAAIAGGMKGTLSAFTATTVNPSTSFTAGTLTMTNTGGSGGAAGCSSGVISASCGTFTFDSGKLAADTQYPTSNTPQLTITNSGTLPASMSLQVTNFQFTNLGTNTAILNTAANVNVSVTMDPAGSAKCLYDNHGTSGACLSLTSQAVGYSPLSTAITNTAAAPISLPGTAASQKWAASESHTFLFYVEIPSGVCSGTACDNQQVTFDVIWTAIQ